MPKLNDQSATAKANRRSRVRVQRSVGLRPENPLQEIARMKKIMMHFRKLTLPSRDFVVWLQDKYKTDYLPEEAG